MSPQKTSLIPGTPRGNREINHLTHELKARTQHRMLFPVSRGASSDLQELKTHTSLLQSSILAPGLREPPCSGTRQCIFMATKLFYLLSPSSKLHEVDGLFLAMVLSPPPTKFLHHPVPPLCLCIVISPGLWLEASKDLIVGIPKRTWLGYLIEIPYSTRNPTAFRRFLPPWKSANKLSCESLALVLLFHEVP